MSDSPRYIEKEEILEWIRQGDIRTYRYRPVPAVSWFLILSGLGTLVLIVLLGIQTAFVLWIHKAALAVLAVYTLWAFWAMGHWSLFVARNYMAFSETEMLVGRGARAYVIPRHRLNRKTIRLEDMRRGRITSVLPIEIGSYKHTIPLVSPFVNLQNVQAFIAEILESILLTEPPREEDMEWQDGGNESAETPITPADVEPGEVDGGDRETEQKEGGN